jgi:DNA-binding LacI/PurR family transcriptional regulator
MKTTLEDGKGPALLSYKYQRVRDRLRQAVENGELAGKLPGERELARRYNANAKTINKALTDLATEGLLIRHVGRGTFVSGPARAAGPEVKPKARTFGYLVAADESQPCSAELYRRIARLLDERGHRLEHVRLPLGPNGELSGRDVRADRLRAYDGMVMFAARPAEDLLAAVSRRHLPLVMVNNNHPTIRTAAVLMDYAHGAFELCQHLIHLGHTRIGLCMDPELLPAARSAEAGYQAAMRRYGLAPQPVVSIDRAGSLEASLPTLKSDQPTAMICIGAAAILEACRTTSATGATSSNGSNKSPAFSICCIAEPGDPLPAEHNLSTYDVDPDQVAYWVAELLLSASPARWQRTVIIPGRILERGTMTVPASPAAVTHSPEATML